MLSRLVPPISIGRDGTNRSDRIRSALDPSSVKIDGRSASEILAFMREHAKILRYYGFDGESHGTWGSETENRGLFYSQGQALALDRVVRYMDDPSAVSAEEVADFARPHFALLLSFVALYRHVQAAFNELPRRHLDFYFRQLLGFEPEPAKPDQVHALISLAGRQERASLPAGTLLDAGKDATGVARHYRTDDEITVSHAQVEQLRSIYVHRHEDSIDSVLREHRGPYGLAAMDALGLALGRPEPGGELPDFDGQELTFELLSQLAVPLTFPELGLGLKLFEFSELMRIVLRRDNDDANWAAINGYLEQAAQRRLADPAFVLNPVDPRDFTTNFTAALGPVSFSSLPDVETLDEVYDKRNEPDLAGLIETFIRTQLFFPEPQDFVAMMRLLRQIDGDWRAIDQLVQLAGRRFRPDPDLVISPVEESGDLDEALRAALGAETIEWPAPATTAREFWAALEKVADYFYSTIEDVQSILEVLLDEQASDAARDQMSVALSRAHTRMTRALRIEIMTDIADQPSRRLGFDESVQWILQREGVPQETFSALEALFAGGLIDPVNYRRLSELRPLVVREDDPDIREELWQETFSILADISPSTPIRSRWHNLYARADATTATVAQGQGEFPSWRTFGQQLPDESEQLEATLGQLGLGIRSSLLQLSEGQRIIELTLGLLGEFLDVEALENAVAAEPFKVEVSTEGAWLELTPIVTVIPDSPEYNYWPAIGEATESEGGNAALAGLRIRVELQEDMPAVTAYAEEGGPPELRVTLRQRWDAELEQYVLAYSEFARVKVVAAHLSVEVGPWREVGGYQPGLSNLWLSNERGALAPGKPFAPFGLEPKVGARLSLTHPELGKPLDELKLHLQWVDQPLDFTQHYAHYPVPGAPAGSSWSVDDFHMDIGMVDRRRSYRLLDAWHETQATRLFGDVGGSEAPPRTLSLPLRQMLADAHGWSDYPSVSTSDIDLDEPDAALWPRYFTWELRPNDFQHRRYAQVAQKRAIELASALAALPEGGSVDNPESYVVNPPYTPILGGVTASYKASVELMNPHETEIAEPDDHDHRLVHVHNFGERVLPKLAAASWPLIPEYENEGELYVGLVNIKPPQNVSLLFQVVEGSSDPDLAPENIDWSYLSGDEWQPMDAGQLLRDSSGGLTGSGVMKFQLREVETNHLLPEDLYWIRASVKRKAASVSDIVAIHAQAVSATLVEQGNDPTHYETPLQAGTIKRLRTPVPGIARIEQPYSSFGAKPAEAVAHFDTRVSEVLRHKHRALTVWDFEHMTLQQFPSLHKVKCIPAAPSREIAEHQAAGLGRVEIVTIPNIQHVQPSNPFAPKLSARMIKEVAGFLRERCPDTVELEVKNAHFVPVRVHTRIRFTAGVDEGFARTSLTRALNQFLSPWAFEEGADIVIGGRIYANSITDFLERSRFVDFVDSITLYHDPKGRGFEMVAPPGPGESYYVGTDRPDAVLIAAEDHEIELVPEQGTVPELTIGINYMQIENDFVVS